VTKIAELITEKTVGIIPVHLFGLAADMDPINALAKEHGLWVMEDAACGFGAKYRGQHVGSLGDVGVFSFHPRKSITTGEGGMVCSDNLNLLECIQQLRDHGAVLSDLQRHLGPKPYLLSDHLHAGYNQRMTDIQGALGDKQMDRAASILKERRSIAKLYNEAFVDLEQIATPTDLDGYEHGYQSYPCLFLPSKINQANIFNVQEARNTFMENLQAAGISTRPATHAIHKLKYYKEKYKLTDEQFINAHIADSCSISLPLFHGMTEGETEHVITNVKHFISGIII